MYSFIRFLISSFLPSVLLVLLAQPASATLITDTANLPPAGVYLAPQDVHARYAGPALTVLLKQVEHKPFAGECAFREFFCREPANLDGDDHPDEVELFNSQLTGAGTIEENIFGIPVGTTAPFDMFGPVQTVVFDKFGQTTGTFDTEMLFMGLTGNILGVPVMLRESPTRSSLGRTSIAAIDGGLFRIDSFFDVFTEISIDNGQSWIPSDDSTRVTLTAIPEPGTVLLVLCGVPAMFVRQLSGSLSRRQAG